MVVLECILRAFAVTTLTPLLAALTGKRGKNPPGESNELAAKSTQLWGGRGLGIWGRSEKERCGLKGS